jgi:hypothetical protein
VEPVDSEQEEDLLDLVRVFTCEIYLLRGLNSKARMGCREKFDYQILCGPSQMLNFATQGPDPPFSNCLEYMRV